MTVSLGAIQNYDKVERRLVAILICGGWANGAQILFMGDGKWLAKNIAYKATGVGGVMGYGVYL